MKRFLVALLMLFPSLVWGVSGKITYGDPQVNLTTRKVWMTFTRDAGGEPCSGLGLRCPTGTNLATLHRPNWWWVDVYVYLDCGTHECTGAEWFIPGPLWTYIGREPTSQYSDGWKYHLASVNSQTDAVQVVIHDWLNGLIQNPTFYLGAYSADHVPATGTCTTTVPPYYAGGATAYIWHSDISDACAIPNQAPASKGYLRSIPGMPPGCKPNCDQVSEKPTVGATWSQVKQLLRED